MQQVEDFRAESEALAEVLESRDDDVFQRVTLFKNWTIDDVIGHLHMFNIAARLTLEDDQKFAEFFTPVARDLNYGKSLLDVQNVWLEGLSGRKLFENWREEVHRMADLYASADPRRRVKWAGPDMSARSAITARQMETWAHGQEVFDSLGKVREDRDRIRNIAHLGINTYGWTFANRKEDVPEPAPWVRLTAPSGAVWEWNEKQDGNAVSGSVTGFCQIVAQTRNVADTDIETTGETAARWMKIAQCFAGPPEDPPAPGVRHKTTEG